MAFMLSHTTFAFAPATVHSASSVVRMQETPALVGPAFAKTLPGVTAPLGFFDPLGFVEEDQTPEQILMYREAELAHGRVSMVAGLGFLVQENFHPIFPDIGGPGARQLDLVLQTENG